MTLLRSLLLVAGLLLPSVVPVVVYAQPPQPQQGEFVPIDQLPPQDQWPVLLLDGVYATPPRLNAAAELLDRALEEGCGARIALVVPNATGGFDEVTYGELAKQVDALAHVLVRDLGLVPGNRVLLRGFNGRWMAAAWLATLKAGMVAVTTMPLLRAAFSH